MMIFARERIRYSLLILSHETITKDHVINVRRGKMKRVRLYALMLSSALFVSAIPVTGVSAAQAPAAIEYTVQAKEDKDLTVNAENLGANNTKKASTKKVKLGWTKKNQKWYYMTAKGYKTGWAKIDGNLYYFNKSGVMLTGFKEINKQLFYFAKSGELKKGWQKFGERWFYFDKHNGAMRKGWLKIGTRTFHLNEKTGVMETGWKKIEGKLYYFNNEGIMLTGPHVYRIGKRYFFFEKSGALTAKKGWQKSDVGNLFYTNADGTVVTNKAIGDKITNEEGVAVKKVNDVMDQKAQWYDGDTKYLVLADLANYELRVYQGKKGNWNKIQGGWELTCGAPATRTPCGQFTLCYKQPTDYGWKDFNLSRAAYVYWTTAGFMIHTILYSKWGGDDPEYVDVLDDRLGMNLSLSCIRLSLENARWIYKNIPTGTTLVVYE